MKNFLNSKRCLEPYRENFQLFKSLYFFKCGTSRASIYGKNETCIRGNIMRRHAADPDPEDPYVLGLLGPNPDPLTRGTDPDPSTYHKNSKKMVGSFCSPFCDFLMTYL
jgi:hypothetical protein